MKITGPDNLHPNVQGGDAANKHTDRTGNFNDFFRKTLERSDSPHATHQSTTLSEPRAAQHLGQPAFQLTDLEDRASKVIDLLDAYATALSNPQKSLREIQSQLTDFVSKTQSLYNAYLETDRKDSRLDDIMETLLRTARLEEFRFQRGDYLDDT